MNASRAAAIAETKRGFRAPRLAFEADGSDWPNRAASRFVRAGRLLWHVQDLGTGPDLLLLHGTGASTHSVAALARLLATRFRVIAPDLPGHAFTAPLPRDQMTLPGISGAIRDLLATLDVRPAVIVGHSAGAAIAIRLCLDRAARPAVIVSLNGALHGFGGVAGRLFQPLARLMASAPFVPDLFARRARDPAVLSRLVERTGSRPPDESVALYARLAADPDHVGAALAMMAGWDLPSLEADFAKLDTPILLVAGGRDGMVPSDQAFTVARRMPRATVRLFRALGHLAHEEAPDVIAAEIETAARAAGVLPEVAP